MSEFSGYMTEAPKWYPEDTRSAILEIEDKIATQNNATYGDDCFPLEHEFVPGMYIRRIFMPAGFILTSKIHRETHPYFIQSGEVEVLTEDGLRRIKAPYAGITKAGTKRVILTHADTVWYTVHSNPDNGRDLKKIEDRIIAKSFADVPQEESICHGPVLQLQSQG